MLFLRDDLFVVVHVSSRSAKARKRDERNVSESASAFARGDNREQRERESVVLLVSNLFPPRGEPKQSKTFDV